MPNDLQTLRDYIKKKGLKDTPQREEILPFPLKTDKHLSSEEVYPALRRKDPKLGRSTVFRTLNLLEECGLASRVTFADGQRKFEAKAGKPHHDHTICVECQEAIEFSSPVIEKLQDRVAKDRGFELLRHLHEMFGRRRRCKSVWAAKR